jgi:hypothetical protein
MYIVAGGAGNIEGLSTVGENVTWNQFAYADGKAPSCRRRFTRLWS